MNLQVVIGVDLYLHRLLHWHRLGVPERQVISYGSRPLPPPYRVWYSEAGSFLPVQDPVGASVPGSLNGTFYRGFWMHRFRVVLGALVMAIAAVSCGGGGDGGGGGGSGSAGAFTLAATSATFRAPRNGAQPAARQIALTLTGTGIAAVGAAFPAGQVPSWLSVNITGTAPNLTLVLQPNSTAMAINDYSATVLVGTTDSNGQVLQNKQVTVSYSVFQGITLSASPDFANFVFGGTASGNIPVSVTAPGKMWTVASDAPWAVGPPAAQSGTGTASINLDVGSLLPGSYTAHITVTNQADPVDTQVISLHTTLAAPTLTASPSPIIVGNADGLGGSSLDVTLSLNTDSTPRSWNATLSGFTSGTAVSSSVMGGSVSGSTPAGLPISVDYSRFGPGSDSGNLRVDLTVKGVLFTTNFPVTINREAQRLFPLYDGVALSNFPSASKNVTSRQVIISDSNGRTGIPWTAVSSDPAWLSVSPTSGVTGDTLTITAAPGALSADQLYNASVTLSSSHAAIEHSEVIRVGLWKGSVDPVDVVQALPVSTTAMVANPVEPWVYLLGGDGTVRVFNVYTGAAVTSYASGATSVGPMTISSDGMRLYVTDTGAMRTIVLDALSATQSIVKTFDAVSPQPLMDPRYGIVVSRPNGHPMEWNVFDRIMYFEPPLDQETGLKLPVFNGGSEKLPGGSGTDPGRVVSPDGRYFYEWSGSSSINVDFHRFTMLNGAHLELDAGTRGVYFSSRGSLNDYCVTPSNHVMVLHPGTLVAQSADLRNELAFVDLTAPFGARAIHCGWNGRVYVGLSTTGLDDNLLVFDDSAGSLAAPVRIGPSNFAFNAFQLRLSGDDTRVIWPGISGTTHTLVIGAAP
jgi:hypothetical protein